MIHIVVCFEKNIHRFDRWIWLDLLAVDTVVDFCVVVDFDFARDISVAMDFSVARDFGVVVDLGVVVDPTFSMVGKVRFFLDPAAEIFCFDARFRNINKSFDLVDYSAVANSNSIAC